VIFISPLIGLLFAWKFKKSQKGDAVTLIAKSQERAVRRQIRTLP
jgi:hypothetical protein